MKRSLMLTLAAIAGTAILAVALIGFRLSQGGLDYSAYAHIADINGNGTITASAPSDPAGHPRRDRHGSGRRWHVVQPG